MNVGERIRLRRKEVGMSADQLADITGVSRSTIFRYENGAIEKMPTSALEPIAKALRTTPAYLMGWEDVNQFDLQRLSLDTGTSLDDLEKISDPNEIMEYSKLMFRAREIRDYEAKLLLPFRTLNSKGQSEAIKRVTELTNLPEYCDWIDTQPIVDKVISTRNQDNSIEPIAAHNDNADDEEQIKLIRKDIERIKGMRKK